jgi:serine/threonine-protein kinase
MDLLERLTSALAGRYRIEREIGRGGMGIVFLAEDLKHDRKVALKVLRPDVAQSVHADRFLREIRIAAKLQHPNILQLIDSGEADGLTYYVMPFVPGESLRDRLQRERELSVEDAIKIAREAADALSYAHEHGVIHRDIKPENILLGSGHALITDFGIASAIGQAAGAKLTETGVAVGTPAYMSPEQADGSGEFDHRTDIYSLGCVLYETLAGAPPFTGSYQAVVARKAMDRVPSLRVVRNSVPPHIEQVVMKALARVPADRFANARQFADALTGDTASLRNIAATTEGRRRWLMAGAVGALLFIGGTYALIAGMPWRRSDTPEPRFNAQLTSQPGVEWFPSLSPDSKWIVYSGEGTGNRDIYLQSVSGQTPINLTKDSPAQDDQPAFSPDGERIAFRSSRDGGGIFVMDRTGEGVRRITSKGFKPTWSHDGSQIAFATENVEMNPGNSEGVSELWIASVARGSEPRRVFAGDGVLPSWSPNGHRIAFMGRLGLGLVGDILTIPADGGQPVPVTADQYRDWSPVWSRDGRFLYYSSDRGGSMNLWRVPIDERTGRTRAAPEQITTPATYLAHPTASADGDQVAYTSALITINIQRLELDPVSGTIMGEPSWVTTGTRRWSSPDPSPDGQWVAFYSLAQPEGHLYLSRPNGTELRRLTGDSGVADRVPRWSPDGEWLTYFSNRGRPLHVWKIRTDGSGLQRVSQNQGSLTAWSPDGRKVATSSGSLGDSAVTQILDPALNFDQQRPQLLPRTPLGPFYVNSWSPDGEKLVGQFGRIGSGGTGIGVYSFRSRTYEKLLDFGEWPVWLPNGRDVLFVADGNSFYMLDSRTRKVRKIYSVTRDVLGPPRLTRDGRYAYFSRRVTEADVWLLSMKK